MRFVPWAQVVSAPATPTTDREPAARADPRTESPESKPTELPVASVAAVGEPQQRRWTIAVGLLVIVAVGAFFRLWQVNALGFNSDEAVYAGQAAAIAEAPGLSEIFPVFRAHPLLFQYVLAVIFKLGVSDFTARIASVVLGLATVLLVYAVGRRLYSSRTGLWAALFVALMSYHVVVTRQALLDGPMVFFATATLFTLAMYGSTHRPRWLYATGAMLGLVFLAKEPGVVLIGSVYAFLALSPSIPVRIRHLALSLVFMALVVAPFPVSVALGGGTETARSGSLRPCRPPPPTGTSSSTS